MVRGRRAAAGGRGWRRVVVTSVGRDGWDSSGQSAVTEPVAGWLERNVVEGNDAVAFTRIVKCRGLGAVLGIDLRNANIRAARHHNHNKRNNFVWNSHQIASIKSSISKRIFTQVRLSDNLPCLSASAYGLREHTKNYHESSC